jgi:hypothetical protein
MADRGSIHGSRRWHTNAALAEGVPAVAVPVQLDELEDAGLPEFPALRASAGFPVAGTRVMHGPKWCALARRSASMARFLLADADGVN